MFQKVWSHYTVTPCNQMGLADKQSLHDLVEWHIASKTDGLIEVARA